MHQSIHQGDIGARMMTQVQGREIRQGDPSGIGQDQHGSPLSDGLADPEPDHRMLFGGIGSDHQKGSGLFGNIFNRIGHGARTVGNGQTGHGAAVSEAGAMVYIVGP